MESATYTMSVGTSEKCGPAPEIPYATHTSPVGSYEGQYELETEVHYSCVIGYHRFNTRGLPTAKCELNPDNVAQWKGPELKCKGEDTLPSVLFKARLNPSARF